MILALVFNAFPCLSASLPLALILGCRVLDRAAFEVQKANKRSIREFAATYGKIRLLIAIAQGEERRVAESL